MARRRSRALFDLVAGFVYSQILVACVRLDLVGRLAAGPRDAAALAPALGLSPDATRTLLRAAASLDLLETLPDGRYALSELGAALHGQPGIAAMIEHHALLYADLADPVAMLRGDTHALADFWAYARNTTPGSLGADQVAPYTALMAASQALVAGEILDAYSMRRHRRLLDVGGGAGAFAIAAGRRWPRLELGVFDLPGVVAVAKERFEASGLAARARLVGGDFFTDPIPDGADLVTLVRVLHDHDDGPVLELLRRIRAALAPAGTLLVAEPMAGAAGAAPIGDAYFGFYLAAMHSGRPRRSDELAALLTQAGFGSVAPLATAMPVTVGLLAAKAD